MPTELEISLDAEKYPWKNVGRISPQQGGATCLIEKVGLLANATQQGRAGLAILVRMPDGTAVVAETSLRNAVAAVAALYTSEVFKAENMDDLDGFQVRL